jgi:hypothetical protein
MSSMAGEPRRFLELVPTPVIGIDLPGQRFDEASGPDSGHQFAQTRGSNVIHHDCSPLQPTASFVACWAKEKTKI